MAHDTDVELEPAGVAVRPVLWAAAASLALMFGAIWGLSAVYDWQVPNRTIHVPERFPSPRVQTHQVEQLRNLLAAQRRQLTGYAWADQGKTLVRIPIERAMEIIAQRGTQAYAPLVPSGPAGGQGDRGRRAGPAAGNFSSGRKALSITPDKKCAMAQARGPCLVAQRSRTIFTALMLLIACGAGAGAGMTQAALDDLTVEPPPGAALPLGLRFLDEDAQPRTFGEILAGKPAVVVFADYTCHTLCGPILTFVSTGLEHSGLDAGADYKLVVIGLDPRDDLQSAHDLKAAHVGSGTPLAAATVMLKGEDAAIDAAASALGYRFKYDAEHDQFAHPAAAFVVNSAGRVSRVLSALGIDGPDLRLALVEAGEGRVGSLGDRLRLLCYGFDAVRGIYTETITWWLEGAAVITVLGMAAAIAVMNAKFQERASSETVVNSAGRGQASRNPRASS